jgi:hypothetical protein
VAPFDISGSSAQFDRCDGFDGVESFAGFVALLLANVVSSGSGSCSDSNSDFSPRSGSLSGSGSGSGSSSRSDLGFGFDSGVCLFSSG